MVSCDRLRLLVAERKLCGNLRPVSLRAAECQCRALCFHRLAFFLFLLSLSLHNSHCPLPSVWPSLCLSSSSFKTPQFYPHFKCNTTGIFLNIFFFIIFVSQSALCHSFCYPCPHFCNFHHYPHVWPIFSQYFQ